MNDVDLIVQLTVFVLAVFVGYEVISKVPAMLHTPLMSGTNAIHGIVIVDLAAEAGGNCELAKPGETYTTDNGVVIAAPLNLPSEMAEHASSLYARNILSLIELGFDFDDEVVAGACVVREGKVV